MKFVSVFMVILLASQAKAQETTTASVSITTEFDIVCAAKIFSLLDCITVSHICGWGHFLSMAICMGAPFTFYMGTLGW